MEATKQNWETVYAEHIHNGLVSSYGILNRKLYGAYREKCPAKRAVMEFWMNVLVRDAKEVAPAANAAIEARMERHLASYEHNYLMASKGASGFQILLHNPKKSA